MRHVKGIRFCALRNRIDIGCFERRQSQEPAQEPTFYMLFIQPDRVWPLGAQCPVVIASKVFSSHANLKRRPPSRNIRGIGISRQRPLCPKRFHWCCSLGSWSSWPRCRGVAPLPIISSCWNYYDPGWKTNIQSRAIRGRKTTASPPTGVAIDSMNVGSQGRVELVLLKPTNRLRSSLGRLSSSKPTGAQGGNTAISSANNDQFWPDPKPEEPGYLPSLLRSARWDRVLESTGSWAPPE